MMAWGASGYYSTVALSYLGLALVLTYLGTRLFAHKPEQLNETSPSASDEPSSSTKDQLRKVSLLFAWLLIIISIPLGTMFSGLIPFSDPISSGGISSEWYVRMLLLLISLSTCSVVTVALAIFDRVKNPQNDTKPLATALISFVLFWLVLGIQLTIGLVTTAGQIKVREAYDAQEAAINAPRIEAANKGAELAQFGYDISRLLIKKDLVGVKALLDPELIASKGETYFDDKLANEWVPFFDNTNYSGSGYNSLGGASGATNSGEYYLVALYVFDKPGSENFKHYMVVYRVKNNTKYLVDINTRNDFKDWEYADMFGFGL